jgi:hypothetical protein
MLMFVNGFWLSLMVYNSSRILYNPRFVIKDMRVYALHVWEVSVARAGEIQLSLAKRVVIENEVINSPHSVDGQGMAHPRRFS